MLWGYQTDDHQVQPMFVVAVYIIIPFLEVRFESGQRWIVISLERLSLLPLHTSPFCDWLLRSLTWCSLPKELLLVGFLYSGASFPSGGFFLDVRTSVLRCIDLCYSLKIAYMYGALCNGDLQYKIKEWFQITGKKVNVGLSRKCSCFQKLLALFVSLWGVEVVPPLTLSDGVCLCAIWCSGRGPPLLWYQDNESLSSAHVGVGPISCHNCKSHLASWSVPNGFQRLKDWHPL